MRYLWFVLMIMTVLGLSAIANADGKIEYNKSDLSPVVAVVKGVVKVPIAGKDERITALFIKYTNVAFLITDSTKFGEGFENITNLDARVLNNQLKDKRVLIYWRRNSKGFFEVVKIEEASKAQIPQNAKFVDKQITPQKFPLKDKAHFKGLNVNGGSDRVENKDKKVYNEK